MRRAFTLIELLTIVAIISVMVTVAVVGVSSGQGASRLRGATRDVFAAIRQARSVALVTQQPAVITYSAKIVDGELCARVEIDSAKLISAPSSTIVQTLSGETVDLADPTGAAAEASQRGGTADAEADEAPRGGESVEDILFAPVDESVMKGVAIKVVVGEEALSEQEQSVRASANSAFSNVDYLRGRYQDAKKKATAAAEAVATEEEAATGATAASEQVQEPVSVTWEPNGRCEPHQVWVYLAGKDPESGLSIKVDRFGAAKVVSKEDE